MFARKIIIGIIVCAFGCVLLPAQTHTAIPLENQVYYILEQAEARGLSGALPAAKPYTRNTALRIINEIFASDSAGKLNDTERGILERYRQTFSKPKNGLDLQRGAYYTETSMGKTGVLLSANIGVNAEVAGSAGLYPLSGDKYFGTEDWVRLYVNGDIGGSISYGFSAEGGLMLAPRRLLGQYWTYYEGFNTHGEFQNQEIDTYSEPLTHFPYSYKKRWDGSIYFLTNLSGYSPWPDAIAGGYNVLSELTGSFFDNKLIARLGRLSHEWGSISGGSSLALNSMARPFLGVEAEFNPFSWFGISTLTGVLEYSNTAGIKDSAMLFQNAFSISMLNFKYKNYFFLDVGESVVWPKRFELGYISPININFFYQNNIGDFDNMALFMNLKAQYPGLGTIWGSLFVDEVSLIERNIFELDRTMWAVQAGVSFPLPFLSFSSIKITYSKINPYCYTHNRNYNPWYGGGDMRMETAYVNNGAGLGYYLPPNSDEILVRFKTMPLRNIGAHLQYQMIRHGADFGSHAVDGSSFLSELDPDGRSTNPILRRYFLQDGAYQWTHIIKLGAEWTLANMPLTFFGEAGTVISYFTDIEDGKANSGKAYPFTIVDTTEYPKSTALIITLGMKLFW